MSDHSAGSASVRIRPNAEDFVRQLNAQLKAVKDPGFVVKVSADMGQATADVRRWRDVESRNGVSLGVDVALGQAQADMAAFRTRQRADGLTIKVDADTKEADTKVAALRQRANSVGTGGALGLNIGALGLGAIQPAIAGLTQLAGAIQQVSGAALAGPGAITGLAASISTLAVGLFGVSDAYSAVSKAALSSGEDAAAAARTSSSASNALRNAVVDETQARKDQANAYRDANNNLRDLNIEMRGGLISESRAVLEAQKAREDLAKGKYSDIRDATLRIEEADQRVLEVRSRNTENAQKLNDAQAKGVEGSDLVVAANERLVRSGQQVADAQAAVAAAAGHQSAAQKAAAQAMDLLSPSAKKFVDTLVEMNPLFDKFRASAQEPLFEGKAEEFRGFFDNVAPIAEKGMSRISAAWNDNITALVTTLGSTQGKGLLDRILGNTGEAQEKLSAAIQPLVMGIGTLSAAGTDALPRLADALGSVATRFSNFITEADKDGRLDKWINDGLTGMASLGESALNIGKSISSITGAGGGGASFLQWLETTTAKWRDWLASTEGQEKVKEFIRDGLDMLSHWGELLAKLPGAFKSMSDAVQPYIGNVIDLMKSLAGFISDNETLVKSVVTAYLTWRTISPVISGVQSAIGSLSGVVTNLGTGFYPMRDKANQAMKDVDDTFTKAGKSGSGLSKFSGALSAIGGSGAAGVMGALTTLAIPALIGAMDKLNDKNKEASTITKQLEADQRALESTLDRVTGKVTAATRDQAIAGARDYRPDGPGAGIPGISQGNAISAATSLGIPPDLYADALVGKPDAVAKVKDILTKNNLAPEFAANPELTGRLNDIRGATHDKTSNTDRLSNDNILAALLGDQSAVQKYNDAFKGTGIDPSTGKYSLAEIAQMLGTTGQASVLAGGALNRNLAALPGAQAGAQQANQADQGRFRIKAGAGSPFPDSAQVNSSGTDAKVTVPANFEGQLMAQNIPFIRNPDGTLTASVPLNSPYIEKYEKGGMVPGSGPKVAIVHGGELVVPAGTVKSLGRFDDGGLVDEYGNPVTQGAAPGPLVDSQPIAPNPTGASGGVGGIFSKVVSGLQGPIGNAIAIGQQLGGMAQSAGGGEGGAGSAAQDPGQALAMRASGIPGFAGLFGSMAINDPKMQQAALTSWASDSLSYVANWGLNTASQVGSTLYQGALGAVGLENSILSTTNPWNQAASSAGGFFMSADGPLAQLAGLGGGKDNGQGGTTDMAALASQYGVTLDAKTLQALYSGNGGAPGSVADLGDLLKLPDRLGGEKGLQIDTIKAKRAIEAAFPEITNIGGVRADRLKWHPNGLAIDVMIPGQGGLNDPTTPEGLALGNRIYDYVMANKDDLGVDYVMWQQKDHYNHLHVNTVGGGYPQMAAGGPTPSTFGPVDGKGGHLAVVHPKEFMISARGRASVPDEFLHKLNKGLVDPKSLEGYFPGGPVPAGAVPYIPPPPSPRANTITVAPPRPSTPAPVQARPMVPTNPAAGAPAPTQTSPQAPTSDTNAPKTATITSGGGNVIGKAPDSLNHNVGWLNTAIESGASTLGQLASTAMSIASMGGAGIPGMGAVGAAGPFVAGLFKEGGKIVEGAVNVLSSSAVGSLPGSFGGPEGASPYGRTIRPEQDAPVTSQVRQTNNTFNGISDIGRLRDMMDLRDDVNAQAVLANHR